MPSGPGVRDEISAEIVELLLTWGATHDPVIGAVLGVAAPRTGLSEVVRALHRVGRALLPDHQRRELDAVLALLKDGAEAAPSLRARMQRAVDAASPHLDRALAARQEALRDALLRHGTEVDAADLAGALQALWSSERSQGLGERIEALANIDVVTGGLDRGAATSEGAARPGPAAGSDSTAASAEISERLARIGALLESHPDQVPGGAASALRLEATREYQRLVDPRFPQASGAEGIESLLSVWEQLIGPALSDPAAGAVALPLDSLGARFDAVMRDHAGILGSEAAGQTATLAAQLRGAKDFAGAAVTLAAAADHLARVRGRSDEARKGAASRLQALAKESGEFLRKQAALLPVERLMNARVHVEQVPAIVAAGTLDEIAALEKAIRTDLSELRSLASTGEQQRTRRAESQRETLQERAEAIGQVAAGMAARRLTRLRAAAAGADGPRLRSLQDRLERIETSIEQSLRLIAAKETGRARRWLKKHAGGGGKTPSPGAQELAALVDDLSKAQGGDDLVALRDRALETRAQRRRLSPAARPSLRVAATLLLLAALAATAFGWSSVRNRKHTVRLTLHGRWSDLWLVRNGRIVEQRHANPGSGSDLDLALPAGRFEVYVDRSFTGRVIRVPEEDVVTDIPLPAPNGAEAPEGGTSHGKQPAAQP